jgi:hypothetical protein
MRLAFAFLVLATIGRAQLTTSQYNNARTGANLSETTLRPVNVNLRSFGKLYSIQVDGDVYAEPLVVAGVDVPGHGKHNLLFIATEHDSVYAFDADRKGPPLWRVSFLDSKKGVSTVPAQHTNCPFINPEVGITSTPVIDAERGIIFVLARTMEQGSDPPYRYVQRLHALDIATGKDQPGSPVVINASVSAGAGENNQHRIAFDPLLENPRAALLLVNGTVYLSWGSSCDVGDYHGWVMAYDAQSLQQRAVFNTSPNAKESAIWQSDTGLAADAVGDVYAVTGNGSFNAEAADYGDSVLKLGLQSGKLMVRDYFTPHDQQHLSEKDLDLGAGGPVLLPEQNGPHRHLMLAGGKDGNLFLIDCDRMGRYDTAIDNVVQIVKLTGSLHAAPAYWNQHVYVFGDNDVLHDLLLSGGKLSRAREANMSPSDPGATPTVSSNGGKDGIVWTVVTRNWQPFPERLAVLHAYDAADISRELYSSGQKPDRDRAGISVRFTIPAVVNGRVYVGARNEVDVYGLLQSRNGP